MSTTTARPASTQLSSRQGQWAGGFLKPGSVLGGCGRQVAGLDALDHAGVGERRDVAERLVLGDVAEQAPHDLARPGLGQVLGEEDRLRLRDRADRLADVVAQL